MLGDNISTILAPQFLYAFKAFYDASYEASQIFVSIFVKIRLQLVNIIDEGGEITNLKKYSHFLSFLQKK